MGRCSELPRPRGKLPSKLSGNAHANDSEEDLQDERSHAKTKVIFIGKSVAEGSERYAHISRSLYGIYEREKSGQEQMNGEPNEKGLETRVAMVLQGSEESDWKHRGNRVEKDPAYEE